jgi:hypothetical protein
LQPPPPGLAVASLVAATPDQAASTFATIDVCTELHMSVQSCQTPPATCRPARSQSGWGSASERSIAGLTPDACRPAGLSASGPTRPSGSIPESLSAGLPRRKHSWRTHERTHPRELRCLDLREALVGSRLGHEDGVATPGASEGLHVEAKARLGDPLLRQVNGWCWGPIFFPAKRALGLWELRPSVRPSHFTNSTPVKE